MPVRTGLLKRIGERLDKKIDRLLLGRQKELDVEKEVQKLNLQIAEVMIQFCGRLCREESALVVGEYERLSTIGNRYAKRLDLVYLWGEVVDAHLPIPTLRSLK